MTGLSAEQTSEEREEIALQTLEDLLNLEALASDNPEDVLMMYLRVLGQGMVNLSMTMQINGIPYHEATHEYCLGVVQRLLTKYTDDLLKDSLEGGPEYVKIIQLRKSN